MGNMTVISAQVTPRQKAAMVKIGKRNGISVSRMLRSFVDVCVESEDSELEELVAASWEVKRQIDNAQKLLDDEQALYEKMRKAWIETKSKNTALKIAGIQARRVEAGMSPEVTIGLTADGEAVPVN